MEILMNANERFEAHRLECTECANSEIACDDGFRLVLEAWRSTYRPVPPDESATSKPATTVVPPKRLFAQDTGAEQGKCEPGISAPDFLDHVADIDKLQDEPIIWHAVCNCGNWDKISDDREELQVWFSEHRADKYRRPDTSESK